MNIDSIKKIMEAYISRNNTCFISKFKFIQKEEGTEYKYKVGIVEMNNYKDTWNTSYYIEFNNHGMTINEIM